MIQPENWCAIPWTLEELEAALIDSKKQSVSTLIDIKVLPKSMTDGYDAW